MGGVARAELAAAVSLAGGLGTLGMVRESPEFIAAQVRQLKEVCDRPYAVNIIPAATDRTLLDEQVACLIELEVPIVTLFWDIDEDCVSAFRKRDVTVIHQVGSLDEAVHAQTAGVDILIVQGREAGGHVRGTAALHQLLPEITSAMSVPIVAAGGIATGQQITAAMKLGAQGVCLGTRFLASEESNAHRYHKTAVVLADAEDTVLTDRFHINWPMPAPVRVLQNAITELPATHSELNDKHPSQEIGSQDGKPILKYSTDSPLRGANGSLELMPLYSGQACSEINSILSVEELMRNLVKEIQSGELDVYPEQQSTQESNNAKMASSPCSVSELNDRYGGYAELEEVRETLFALLAAERAGAQVCALSLKDVTSMEWQQLLLGVHRDEAGSCKLLIDCLENLQIEPHEDIGDFVGKCMSIPNFIERMELLNKGQAWVVRKLDTLLPRLRSEFVREKLIRMRDEHLENISKLEVFLETRRGSSEA